MSKIYTDKSNRFVWANCSCGHLAVFAKEPGYKLTPKDEKHMAEITGAVFYPKKFVKFEEGCNTDRWSRHIVLND